MEIVKKTLRSKIAVLLEDNLERKKKEEKTTQAAKSSSHQLRERGHSGRKAPSPEKTRKQSVRNRRVAGRQASRPLLIGLKVRRILKRTQIERKLKL